MQLTRDDIINSMTRWEQAWNDHDIDGVMALFHENVLFEHWYGTQVQGWEALRRAWAPWFERHGNFRFTTEDLIVDEADQKVLYAWLLEWPSLEKGYEGKLERRRGVDVLHFREGRIAKKVSYSKTVLEIDGQKVKLLPA